MGDIQRLKTNWRGSAHLRDNAADRSPESVAMVLRNARVLLGYDLDEVANALNIRAAHLEALEDGRFADLPPLVYAQGFVAAYADFLELDRNELVNRFREEASGAPVPLPTIPQFNLNSEPDAAERRIPSIAVVVVGFVLIALAYGLWQASLPSRREEILAVPPLPTRFNEEAFEALPSSAVVTPAPVAPAAPVAAQPVYATPVAPEVQAYQGAGAITIKSYGESWVQLRNAQGQRVASLMMHAGQTYTVPGNYGELQLSTGNINTIVIMVDGRMAPQKSSAGRTRYDVMLNPQRLLDGSAVLN